MATQQELTTKQVSILLWIKALNDFKGEGFEDSTFDEKFHAFEAVEDTGFSREEYDTYVDFWIENKVLEENAKTNELSITKQGKRLFELIESEGAKSDDEIKAVLNSGKKQTTLDRIVECVRKHPQEIIGIVSLCLQGAQLAVSIIKP